ncbi:MAG: 2-amino-4-hydroxy-6-hydroxymethyldihydropteridine diphosphokinase [Steroidobacteraceae bacterium]|jgi:2-amino-4-hydroxy-6-hydroxymethyldihydropteridine diphosphokinase
MSQVFIAIGGNVDPAARLPEAARALKARFADTRFSACYRNPAAGFEGADFLNAVAGFSTELPVPELLHVLHEIEALCGRSRDDPKWGPRALDLDLLLYDDVVGEGPGYTLPRPDLLRRIYMLGPLAELAPQWPHPLCGRSIGELWAAFPRAEGAMMRTGPDLNAL